jgi:hypothetical protein
MTLFEILVIISCVLIVGGVIALTIINKKKGKSSCGCDCSKCTCGCNKVKTQDTNKNIH